MHTALKLPVTKTSKEFCNILMVGLDGTGKTTMRKMLKRNIMLQTEPTGEWGVSMYLFRWRFKEYIFSICARLEATKTVDICGGISRKTPFWPVFCRMFVVLFSWYTALMWKEW